MYIIRFSKQADKDKRLLKRAGLELKAKFPSLLLTETILVTGSNVLSR